MELKWLLLGKVSSVEAYFVGNDIRAGNNHEMWTRVTSLLENGDVATPFTTLIYPGDLMGINIYGYLGPIEPNMATLDQ